MVFLPPPNPLCTKGIERVHRGGKGTYMQRSTYGIPFRSYQPRHPGEQNFIWRNAQQKVILEILKCLDDEHDEKEMDR